MAKEKTFLDYFRSIDCLGNDKKLLIKRHESYKTTFGAFNSIFLIIVVLGYSAFLLLGMVQRS